MNNEVVNKALEIAYAAAFKSLDERLESFMRSTVFAEWSEWLSLFKNLLANPRNLIEFQKQGPLNFSLSQWKASLACYALHEKAESFKFNYTDAGIFLILYYGGSEHKYSHVRWAQKLFELQKLKHYGTKTLPEPREEFLMALAREVEAFVKEGKKLNAHFQRPMVVETSKIRAA